MGNYKCKFSERACERCPYSSCVDGMDADEALMIVAEYNNKEDIRKLSQASYHRDYYERNREKITARRKEAYLKEPEKFKKRSKTYQQTHREQVRETKREYNRAHTKEAHERYMANADVFRQRSLDRYYRNKAAANG